MITQNHIKAIELIFASEIVDLIDTPIEGKILFSIGGAIDQEDLEKAREEWHFFSSEYLKKKTPNRWLT